MRANTLKSPSATETEQHRAVRKVAKEVAAVLGAVSASCMVEQVGLPRLSPDILLESRRREALFHTLGEEKK